MMLPRPRSTLFPYTTLFRSRADRNRCSLGDNRTGGSASGAGRDAKSRHPNRHRNRPLAGGGGGPRTSGNATSPDRKSTRLNSSHTVISYAVFCLKKKIARVQQAVRAQARWIVDAVAPKGACDFVEEVAAALPLRIICDMMGIPDAHHRRIFERTT